MKDVGRKHKQDAPPGSRFTRPTLFGLITMMTLFVIQIFLSLKVSVRATIHPNGLEDIIPDVFRAVGVTPTSGTLTSISNSIVTTPDFGGLYLHSTNQKSHLIDNARYDREREAMLNATDDVVEWVEFGDTWMMQSQVTKEMEFNRSHACRENSWRDRTLPTCNLIHEITQNLNRKKVLGYVSKRGKSTLLPHRNFLLSH